MKTCFFRRSVFIDMFIKRDSSIKEIEIDLKIFGYRFIFKITEDLDGIAYGLCTIDRKLYMIEIAENLNSWQKIYYFCHEFVHLINQLTIKSNTLNKLIDKFWK